MGYGLTPRQKKLFDFIKSYMKKEPVAPSYEEMMRAAGLRSKSGVHKIVLNLEARGWLTRLPGKNRSIRISK
jgi:repressor LexA|tara:strand:- start:114 stop:329 length:216 start_codon:yes stop_codon:yes gene_type:complete